MVAADRGDVFQWRRRSGALLQLLGVAWTAWRIGVGASVPSAVLFAGLAVAAFVLLENYVEANHPGLYETVEGAV